MRILRRFLALLLVGCVFSLVACGPGESAGKADVAPVITSQPASATSTGVTATVFKVVATGGGLTYQWSRDGKPITGATQASLSTTTAGSYTVVVSNTLGSVTSDAAVLTVSVDPAITAQPQPAAITAGKTAQLSVVATGVSLTYQWYRDGTLISGAVASSYGATVAGSYTVVVSSTRSGAKAVTSSAALVTVSATGVAPSLVTSPVALRATSGSAASFSVVAAGTDLVYQWFKDGVALPAATNPSYAMEAVAAVNAGNYHVLVSNSLGYVASAPVSLSVTAVDANGTTAAVVAAANAFLDTLTSTQKAVAGASSATSTVQFADALDNARSWSSFAGARHGLRLNASTLSTVQLTAADVLLSTALSAAGATQVSEIRLSDDVLAGLDATSGAGAGLYSIAFIGQPSLTQPWTLQISGHQLAHNISYNTSLPSATPMFLGAEPPNWVFVSAGVYLVNNTATSNGTAHAPMESQRQAVATLANSLQADATLAVSAKLPNTMTDLVYGPTAAGDVRYKNQSYPTGTTSRGALYTTLNSTQQAAVKAMVQAWAATQTADLADNLLNAYLADTALASTYVAYAPGLGGRADFSSYPNASALPGSTGNSYLRIDGPRVWIEFLVQSNGSTAGRVHYRSVWRDKQADYGGRF